LEETNEASLTTKFYLLKVIELISLHLGLYDCAGLRVIYNQLIKILTDFSFSQGLFKEISTRENNHEYKPKDNLMYLQLMKASHLLNIKNSDLPGKSKPELDLVTG
jgi:hypothetical protein